MATDEEEENDFTKQVKKIVAQKIKDGTWGNWLNPLTEHLLEGLAASFEQVKIMNEGVMEAFRRIEILKVGQDATLDLFQGFIDKENIDSKTFVKDFMKRHPKLSREPADMMSEAFAEAKQAGMTQITPQDVDEDDEVFADDQPDLAHLNTKCPACGKSYEGHLRKVTGPIYMIGCPSIKDARMISVVGHSAMNKFHMQVMSNNAEDKKAEKDKMN